ncbi:endo-1,4-beta-xylanase A precursor [Moorella thermoacetica]|uniref:Endo-1,4-beta-xylanase A n=1 Tax=Neomoorella thermoacetica TaxID=1525 RepID=A0A1J5NCG0_NEOTH|nr:endo-1,4-beta-xylanase A precursor [Moorella thermoacetica]
MFFKGMKRRFLALTAVISLLLGFLTTFIGPVLVEAGTVDYNGLVAKAIQFNQQAFSNGEKLSAYDAYVLTLAGEDLSAQDWVYNGESLQQSILDAVYATIGNPATAKTKDIAYELLAVKAWGDSDLAGKLAAILADKQGPNGFDNNVYSDMPVFDALGRAGEFSVVNVTYAREYLLNTQCTTAGDNYGAWGSTWGTDFYPDFMTTCQAIRALTYLPDAARDHQIQAAINNGLAYLRQWQQEDGSVYTTKPWLDDPAVDTAELIATLQRLDIDPASWKSARGMTPVDYMVQLAPNSDGSFGTTKNALDATEALYAYLILEGRTGSAAAPGLAITPATATVNINGQQQYKAVMNYLNGTSSDVTRDAAWSVEDGNIAEVVNGLATGRQTGQTVVRATYNGLAATAGLTVTASASSSGGGSGGCTVDIAVVGRNGELLYGPGAVTVSKDGRWGLTALGALEATGLPYEEAGGFVKSIAGLANSGMNGWMYKVNGNVPMVGASQEIVRDGDQVIWWYSTDLNSPGPTWDSLLKGSTPASPANTTPADLKEQNKKLPAALQAPEVALEALGKINRLLELKDDAAEIAPLGEVKRAVVVTGSDKAMNRDGIIALKKELLQNKIDLAQEVSASAGAIISDPKAEIALSIPAGALTKDVEITVKKGTGGNTAPTSLPAGYRQISAVYNFGPDGTTFAVPVTLNLKFALPPLVQPENLAFAWYDKTKASWVALPAVVDLSKGLILARIYHFSDYAVFVKEARKAFLDVTPASFGWAQDTIETLAGAGIVAGVDGSRFEPGRAVTRAEFASLLVKALGLKVKAGEKNPFKDVKGDAWYAVAVTAAAGNGLVKGYEDGTFRPDNVITREELAAMLVRAVNLPAGEEKLAFKDSDKVSTWARKSVAIAAASGLIKGFEDGTFRPGDAASRAECAVMVYRVLVAE